MSNKKKQYVGKIGYCNNRTLGIKGADGKPLSGGHYVYIREKNGDKCNINVITSLERQRVINGIPVKDKNGKIITDFTLPKIEKVKKGYLYPIPKTDANFKEWSAINLDGNIKNIPVARIQNIGIKSIKNRHRYYVGKFTKK